MLSKRMGLLSMPMMAVLLLAGLTWLFTGADVQPARAASIVVTKFTDSNDGACNADCSLREAIIAANLTAEADTITLATGTYILDRVGVDDTASAGDLDITKPLTIIGQGAGQTIIQQTIADRVFHVRSGAVTVIFEDLTITGGQTTYGAGILTGGVNLKLYDVTVRENNAANGGGGMNISTGLVEIVGGQFITNTCGWEDGGGIRLETETSTLHQSGGTLFSGNTSQDEGGAIYVQEGTAEMEDATLVYNTAWYGGAVSVDDQDASLTLVDGLVTHNTAFSDGGGLRTWDGTIELERVAVIHNTADNLAGGIMNQYGTLKLVNVTVSHNTAQVKTSVGGGGGGLYLGGTTIFSSQTTMIHSTIVENVSDMDASGIALSGGKITAFNSIVAGNTPGPNCMMWGRGEVLSDGGNFEDTDTCTFTDPSDFPATEPQLGALALAGYHIPLPGSPVIDAATCDPAVTEDQRGTARPSGAACDSGAIEALPPTPTPITGVTITGPTSGLYGQILVYTAHPAPEDATLPIVYTWTPAPISGQGTATASFRWNVLGPTQVSVHADNTLGEAQSVPYAVTISGILIFLPLVTR